MSMGVNLTICNLVTGNQIMQVHINDSNDPNEINDLIEKLNRKYENENYVISAGGECLFNNYDRFKWSNTLKKFISSNQDTDLKLSLTFQFCVDSSLFNEWGVTPG